MTIEAYKRIERAMEEAEAYLKGDMTGAIKHEVEVKIRAPGQAPIRPSAPSASRKPRC